MNRTLIGVGLGNAVCLALLPVWGAYHGLLDGVQTARIPPGVEAAVNSALCYPVFFWPLAVAVGTVAGGLAGLVSWAVSRLLTGRG